MNPNNHHKKWCNRLSEMKNSIPLKPRLAVEGRITRMIGLTLESVGCQAAIGDRCLIRADARSIEAEVVGFSDDKTYLMPSNDIRGLQPGAKVTTTGKSFVASVGEGLLGRVIDGSGTPLDGKGPLNNRESISLMPRPLNPILRHPITEPLNVGVRAINGLLTIARGQRLGLFAGSGVGKSVLLGMMTRNTDADITVVAMIGERGREVKEFTENILGQGGMSNAVVVASPADTPPMLRMHGAMLATSIAEYYREKGLNVLLLMDSLTRFAQAQREIGLAIGEPPTTKGYPPSVFSKLPQLVERAGNSTTGSGSITALYTVLAEGDDQQDPIADAARAILDGHIVLSRELAEAGHYPAIDIESSISRSMNNIVSEAHQNDANRLKGLYSLYNKNKDLINVGAYSRGSNAMLDQAIDHHHNIEAYLKQGINEPVALDKSIQDLSHLIASVANTTNQPSEGVVGAA